MRLYSEAAALSKKAQTSVDMRQAADKFEQALAIFQQAGFKEGIVPTATALGIMSRNWDQYDKAVDYYTKALLICPRDPKSAGRRKYLGQLRRYLLALGTAWKGNKEYYEKSLAIARDLNDRKGEGRIYRQF